MLSSVLIQALTTSLARVTVPSPYLLQWSHILLSMPILLGSFYLTACLSLSPSLNITCRFNSYYTAARQNLIFFTWCTDTDNYHNASSPRQDERQLLHSKTCYYCSTTSLWGPGSLTCEHWSHLHRGNPYFPRTPKLSPPPHSCGGMSRCLLLWYLCMIDHPWPRAPTECMSKSTFQLCNNLYNGIPFPWWLHVSMTTTYCLKKPQALLFKITSSLLKLSNGSMRRDETWYVCLLYHDDYMFPWRLCIVWKSLRQLSLKLSSLLKLANCSTHGGETWCACVLRFHDDSCQVWGVKK